MSSATHVVALFWTVDSPSQNTKTASLGFAEIGRELIVKIRGLSGGGSVIKHFHGVPFDSVLDKPNEEVVLHADQFDVALADVGRHEVGSSPGYDERNPAPICVHAVQDAVRVGDLRCVDPLTVEEGSFEAASRCVPVPDGVANDVDVDAESWVRVRGIEG
ncbi:hypothetical protein HG530_010801 [Fusarium avenaceum]|nr:hypothetical protein HG530_010801 [Fusarium avenaceum]